MMENKYSKLEKVLDENHVLLTEEKTRREQLFLQVESLTYQLSSKQKEVDTSSRDKTILREKLSESESKYDNVKRKFDYLHQ